MYIQTNKKTNKSGKTYTSYLLCHKYREDGKIKTKVLTNLSMLSIESIHALKLSLKKTKEQVVAVKDIIISKSFDFGYVFLLLHVMKLLRIPDILNTIMPNYSNLLQAMIIGKIITRGSKLAIFNFLSRNGFLATKLGIDISKHTIDDFYTALGEVSYKQEKIEKKWMSYHKDKFQNNNIFLYDMTSSYFEGTKNELAAFGYNRDKKKGKKQINIGLITNDAGFPLTIQTFKGNITDQLTVKEQIEKIRSNASYLSNKKIVFVGDRGMKIRYNLEEMDNELLEEVDYITGLSVSEIRTLQDNDVIQPCLFSKNLAEVEHDGRRYILSTNPELKRDKNDSRILRRAKFDSKVDKIKQSFEKRRDLNLDNIKRLAAKDKNKKLVTKFTEKALDRYKFRVKKLLDKYKMSAYHEVKITNLEFGIIFDQDNYKKSEALDGKYVLETTISKERMDKSEIRENYKNLKHVENAFRELKSMRLEIRPIHHRKAAQTNGHVLLCMFSYAILKTISDKIFPWLKNYNEESKKQLSFEDITEELKMIKMNELNFGTNYTEIKYTEFNEKQTEIFNLFGVKKIK